VSLFVPLGAKASFLSSLIGGEKGQADTLKSVSTQTPEAVPLSHNSQTVPLLEANVSFTPRFVNKGQKDDKDKKATEVLDVASIAGMVQGNALVPVAGPRSVTEGVGDGDFSFDQMSIYVVRKGDTVSEIAEMFGVSTNTILWANDLKRNQKLTVGNTLLILPVSGVKHEVAKGQNLGSIAKQYKVDVAEIVDFNGLSDGAKLAVGDELIIPDGIVSSSGSSSTSSSSSSSSSKSYYSTSTLKNIAGYFINPVPKLKRKSQGLHGPGNRGIDLAAPTGTHIYASAPGKVLLARNGYNGGYGNMVIIEHPNGTKTLYAHMNKLGTTTGSNVERGELIGYVGSTGRSTGPHLHFEVFNAKNPGADWTWAN
jgi:LysM repeat protein